MEFTRLIHLGVISGLAVLVAVISPASAMAVAAATTEHIIISAVSPQSSGSASEETIELYNPGEGAVDITGWKLQYRSASSIGDKKWTTKATAACQNAAADCKVTLEGQDTLTFASYDMGDAAMPLSSGMALAGGQVRLVDADGSVQDMVGYGSAATYEGEGPAPTPKPGQGVVRAQDADGNYADTDDNKTDFVLAQAETMAAPVEPGRGAAYLTPAITEVLPDPVSPALDSEDEFIELYNPYSVPLDLSGYVLKTGSTWSHSYTVQDVIIEPFDYVVLTSAQTHLTLSNSGSGVRLYDPAGTLMAEMPSYGKAKPGQSWAQDTNGQWAWTTTPTPGEQNVLSVPPAAVAAAPVVAKTKVSTAKKTAAKKTSTTKSSTKKSSTPKSAVLGQQNSGAAASAATTGGSPSYLLFVGLGAVAVGYGLFEYRQELAGLVRRGWQALAAVGKK